MDPSVNPFALQLLTTLGEQARATICKPCRQRSLPCKLSKAVSALVQEGEAALSSKMKKMWLP